MRAADKLGDRPSSTSQPLSSKSGVLYRPNRMAGVLDSPQKMGKVLQPAPTSIRVPKMRKEDLSHTLTKFAPLLNNKNQTLAHPEPVVKKIDGSLQLSSKTLEQNKLEGKHRAVNESGSQISKSEIYRRNSSNARQPSVVRTNGLLNTRPSIHKDNSKKLGPSESPIVRRLLDPVDTPLTVRVKKPQEQTPSSTTETRPEAKTPATPGSAIVPKGIDMAAVLRSPKPGFFIELYNQSDRAILPFHASTNYTALSDSARQANSMLMKPVVVYDSTLPPSSFSKINNLTSQNGSDDIGPLSEGLISTSVNKIMQPNPSSLSAMVDRLITAQLSQPGAVSTTVRKGAQAKRSISCQNAKQAPPKTPNPPSEIVVPPPSFYTLKDQVTDHTLVFQSRFESANLRRVIQTERYSYDLILNPDIGTGNHTQWYYFKVSNTRAGKSYNFNIVNLLKPDSLFNQGLRPLTYSTKAAEITGMGWRRSGEKISYFQNGIPKNGGSRTDPVLLSAQALLNNGQEPKQFVNNPALRQYGGQNFYTLKFSLCFEYDHDQVYICHAFPYPYSYLKHQLSLILANRSHQRDRIRRSLLCKTIAGNEVDLLIVTNFASSHMDIAVRKAIILTARVHPGETGGSWMMQGALEFLISDHPEAQWLRNKYVFKLVPMLNPDGVVMGNTRCSLSGKDLNRCWGVPSSRMHPEIYHTKQMIRITLESREIEMYCDLHSHSRKTNAFFYGCSVGTNNENNWLKERIIPFLLSNRSDAICYSDCSFVIHKGRETCGRVVVRKEFNVINSYTLEASFLGSSLGVKRDCHFTPNSLKAIGSDFMLTMKDFNEKFIFDRTLSELQSVHGQPSGVTRPIEVQADGQEVSRQEKNFQKNNQHEETKRSIWAIKGTAVKPRIMGKSAPLRGQVVNIVPPKKKRVSQMRPEEAGAGEGGAGDGKVLK